MDLNTPTASKVVGGLSCSRSAASAGSSCSGRSPAAWPTPASRSSPHASRTPCHPAAQHAPAAAGRAAHVAATGAPPGQEVPADRRPAGPLQGGDGRGSQRRYRAQGRDHAGAHAPGHRERRRGVTADPPAPGSGSLASQPCSVSVTGTYDQTQQLFRNLEHMPRAYLITSVALAGGGDGTTADTFTTTIAGEMFVMPPVADPGKTMDLDATTTTN